jgi:chorismate mutase
MKLFAVRGATTVQDNDGDEILAATEELVAQIMARNTLSNEDVVSAIFTTTADLDAQFPALAARSLGAPMLCAREIDVPGSMRRVIRVMMHYYAPDDHSPSHVYLGEAQALRVDLQGPQ